MYNFRFDSDQPAIQTNATVGFFKTGGPMPALIQAPGGVPDTFPYADTYRNGNSNSYSYRHRYVYTDPDCYCDSNRHGYFYAYSNGNVHAHSYSYAYCDSHCNCDCDRNSKRDTLLRPRRLVPTNTNCDTAAYSNAKV